MNKDLEIMHSDGSKTKVKDGTRITCFLDIATTNEYQQQMRNCTPVTDVILIVVKNSDWYVQLESSDIWGNDRLYSKDIKGIPVFGKMLYAVCFTQICKAGIYLPG